MTSLQRHNVGAPLKFRQYSQYTFSTQRIGKKIDFGVKIVEKCDFQGDPRQNK